MRQPFLTSSDAIVSITPPNQTATHGTRTAFSTVTPPSSGVPTWLVLLLLFIVGNIVVGGLYFAKNGAKDDNDQPPKTAELENAAWRAHRARGLALLEQGNFAEASDSFQSALTHGAPSGSDVAQLLAISAQTAGEKKGKKRQSKKERPKVAVVETKKAEPSPAKVVVTPVRRTARQRPTRRRPAPRRAPAKVASVQKKPEPKPIVEEAPSPVIEEADEGALLVASSPSGLTIEVDGAKRGKTPLHMKLEIGSHRVRLKKGAKVLLTKTVNIVKETMQTIDADLTEKLAPKEPEPVAIATVAPVEKKPTPVPEKEVAVRTKETAKPAVKRKVATGTLKVVSPNLRGVVWLDGKIRLGFVPIVIPKVAVGLHRVELRVDGKVRRTKPVRIRKSQRKTVRF